MQDPGRSLPSLGWNLKEVEEYTPEFEMYWEAARCVWVGVRVCVRVGWVGVCMGAWVGVHGRVRVFVCVCVCVGVQWWKSARWVCICVCWCAWINSFQFCVCVCLPG